MRKIITTFLLASALGLGEPALVLGDSTPAPAKEFDYGSVELRAGVWLDRSSDEVYQSGERMEVGFQVNKDSYAVVYRIDVDGGVTILWPRSRLDDGFVFATHEYQVPVSGSTPLLTGRDEGEGFVEILASRYPYDLRGLQIDFHGEDSETPFDYAVAGDPFLAINDINYAITGLKDTANYVVSDFSQYYVHRKVDHPRYLCSQCHIDQDEQYDPYEDRCSLDIEEDYGWSNRWYDSYGYYPVYAQPVYIYVDPWNSRPWVNFWYWPSYTCGPTLGYSWYSSCWVWNDSPYYYGDVYYYNRSGGRRYRPLTPGTGRDVAHKTREYARVTPLVKGEGPTASQRTAMTRRTPGSERNRTYVTGDRGQRGSIVAGSGFRGQPQVVRSGPVVTPTPSRGVQPGLRIRKPGTPANRTSTRSGQDFRHIAGNSTARPALRTADSPSGRVRSVRNPGPARKPATVRTADKPAAVRERTIRPVEPRRRGTRIWNSGGTSSRGHEQTERVAPRKEGQRSKPKQTPRVTPRTRDKSSTGKSQKRESIRSRSSGTNSNTKASSHNSNRGGSSRSSGGKSSSRSSSGSHKRMP